MMATFVYFFVPETMGRSLEEMDDIFGMLSSPYHLLPSLTYTHDVGAPEGMSRAEFELSQGKTYKPAVRIH